MRGEGTEWKEEDGKEGIEEEVSNTSESKAMNITVLAVYKLRDRIRHGEQMSVKGQPQRVRR